MSEKLESKPFYIKNLETRFNTDDEIENNYMLYKSKKNVQQGTAEYDFEDDLFRNVMGIKMKSGEVRKFKLVEVD